MMAGSRYSSMRRWLTAQSCSGQSQTKKSAQIYWRQELTAGSQQRSKRCIETARVEKRAVAVNEISLCRLKARMKAFGHLCSVWRSMTARVILEAVAVNEMTFYLLLAKTWYMKIIPSSNVKLNKVDCFVTSCFKWTFSVFIQERTSVTAYGIWFNPHMSLRMFIISQNRRLASLQWIF